MKKLIPFIAISIFVITTCLAQTTDSQYIAQRAAVDAFIHFPELHLRPGRDGKFNWFEVGFNLSGVAEQTWTEYYHRDKNSPEFRDYEKAYENEVNRICRAIQNGDASNWREVRFPKNYGIIKNEHPDPMFSAPIETAPSPSTNEVVNEPSPDIARAESQLRRTWNLLSPARKAELRDEQERWEQIKDTSNDQIKLKMIQERTIYLLNRA